jgi:hypothetical protein
VTSCFDVGKDFLAISLLFTINNIPETHKHINTGSGPLENGTSQNMHLLATSGRNVLETPGTVVAAHLLLYKPL